MKLLSAVIVGLAIAAPTIRKNVAFAQRRRAARKQGGGSRA